MKKLFRIVFVLFISLSLVGCQDSAPKDMSDASYGVGNDIIALADKYLDGNIEKDEFETTIAILIDKVSGNEVGDVKVRERAKQIKSSISISDDSVKESKDKLAEALGK